MKGKRSKITKLRSSSLFFWLSQFKAVGDIGYQEFPYDPKSKEKQSFCSQISTTSRYPPEMANWRFTTETATVVFSDRVSTIVKVVRVEDEDLIGTR